MTWSIAQVARMSKVTSRTLRHYDEIGLLPPAWVGGNGYRYYNEEQLLRLQQILVLRELGLGLESIAEILDERRDQVSTLRLHHKWLLAERDRFDRLARTVEMTIAQVEGDDTMTDKSTAQWFDGFDSDKQAQYREEARQRWGAGHVDAANARVEDWSKDRWARVGGQWVELLNWFVELIDAGRRPDEDEVLDAIDGHYRWICQFWTPHGESYTGLADLYAHDSRFRARFDATDPRLAEFLRAAMAAYARARLA